MFSIVSKFTEGDVKFEVHRNYNVDSSQLIKVFDNQEDAKAFVLEELKKLG